MAEHQWNILMIQETKLNTNLIPQIFGKSSNTTPPAHLQGVLTSITAPLRMSPIKHIRLNLLWNLV